MKIEDIRNGIAENPELKTALLTDLEADFTPHLTGKGFVVRTADEQTAWEKTFEDNKINPRIKEIYGNLEKDTLDSFAEYGLKKEQNTEKVYDLIKKGAGLVKAKIADIELKLADALAGKGDDVTQKQLLALKDELTLLKGEKETLTNSFTAKELAWKAGNDQDKAFAELHIAVPAHIAEKDKGDFIANKRGQLLTTLNSIYKIEERDGKLVYLKDGEVQMKGAEIATAKDLLEIVGKYDFTTKEKGGSGGEGGAGGDNATDYAGVTDKDSLYAAASKKGLTLGSEAWTKFVTDGCKAKNIKIEGISDKK